MPTTLATEIAETLDRSVRYALETMCFAEAAPVPASEEFFKRATVPFRASFAGRLELEITPAAAHTLTSALLGLQAGETPAEIYVDDTMCELGTVICGRFLSSLDPSAPLHLEHAQLAAAKKGATPPDLRLGFQIDDGTIAVSLQLD